MANGVGVALIVVVALLFDYTNGFHDAANAIATWVLTLPCAAAVAALLYGLLRLGHLA